MSQRSSLLRTRAVFSISWRVLIVVPSLAWSVVTWHARFRAPLHGTLRALRWTRLFRRLERRIIGAMNEDVPDQFPVRQRGPTATATRIGIAPSLPRPLDECRAVDVA